VQGCAGTQGSRVPIAFLALAPVECKGSGPVFATGERPPPGAALPYHRDAIEAHPSEGPSMSTESTSAGVIHSSIEIDAPPARVWEVISDVRNATQWSSQAVKIIAPGGRTTKGTRALNINKRGPMFWPTTSRVVEFEPGRKFANRINENTTIWV